MPPRDHAKPDDPPPNHALAGLRALREGLPSGPVEGDPPPLEDRPGEPPATRRLVVGRERKGHGGKTATRVAGLASAGNERERIAKDLKRALGVGARWDADDLLVQGGEVERIARWFETAGYRVVRGNA